MKQVNLPILEAVPEKEETTGFGTLSTPNGNLPLKALEVRTRIAGLLAHTTVCQTFVNTHAQPLEATYIFPLPDRAAVTSFVMEVAGRKIEGVLEERSKAREHYDEAIRQGHRAAIAEEERPNVFTLRVGNLMPKEQAWVTMTLAAPLAFDSGEVTYRFPLVVAPRYIPGTPLEDESVGDGVAPDTDEAPDASRITPPVLLPGFPNPVRLSLEVEIDGCGLPIQNLHSSLHAVMTEEADDACRVRLNPGERLNRDFILRYNILGDQIRTGAMLSPDAQGDKQGTFALILTAPKADTSRLAPRDVVFVLDRSGSMDGWKMVAARRAMGRLIDTFTPQDRFAVIAFDNTVETLNGATLEPAADRQRYRAIEWLSRIDARGGTEMHPALQRALGIMQPRRADAMSFIVLITDGQVGNEDAILRQMVNAGITVFTVGIDQALNDAFLRRLSEATGGACEAVESEDRLDEVMERVQQRLGQPVLRDVTVHAEGVQVESDSLVPSGKLHLFSNGTTVITGRWQGTPTRPSFRVSATSPDGTPWQATPQPQVKLHPALRPVWARGMIRALEDRYLMQRSSDLESRIVKTSLQHGVLSRFTAYIAIDRPEVVNQGGQVCRIVQPVEAPAGWGMFEEVAGVALAAAPRFYRAKKATVAYECELSLRSDLSPTFLTPPGYTGSVTFGSPKEALESLMTLDRSDERAMRDFLNAMFPSIEQWLSSLRGSKEASNLVPQLEQLRADIEAAFTDSPPSQAEMEPLLDRCCPLLEELARRDLPRSRRRLRWW